MSVYVDRAKNAFGRLVMCHMIADTPEELHAMADRIGVARRWFQAPPKASFWHYDIAQSKRALAIASGAIECERTAFVEHLRRIRASGVFGAFAVCPKCELQIITKPVPDLPAGLMFDCTSCLTPFIVCRIDGTTRALEVTRTGAPPRGAA